MVLQVTAEQFQEYHQQWTQSIVEEGGVDVETQRQQRKLNAAYWVAYCSFWETGGVERRRAGEAMQILEQVVQEQDIIAINNNHDKTGKHRFLLAVCHNGQREQQRADELFRQAAPRLEIEAQRGGNDDNHKIVAFYLAVCLYWGEGVDKDMRRGIHWYKIAAELGIEDAQNVLAYGCRKEPTVFDWFKQMAVEHEHAWAQFALGRCYESGEGVEKDWIKAVEWYNKAIAQGNDDATRCKRGLLDFLSRLSPEEHDKTLGGVERNQKIEKARALIQQQPTDSVPLGIWAFTLGSFQNPIHHPCESPSPTFIALCEGIMPQFQKKSDNGLAEVVLETPCSNRKRSWGEISTTCCLM